MDITFSLTFSSFHTVLRKVIENALKFLDMENKFKIIFSFSQNLFYWTTDLCVPFSTNDVWA